jgi:hypothetical protein
MLTIILIHGVVHEETWTQSTAQLQIVFICAKQHPALSNNTTAERCIISVEVRPACKGERCQSNRDVQNAYGTAPQSRRYSKLATGNQPLPAITRQQRTATAMQAAAKATGVTPSFGD